MPIRRNSVSDLFKFARNELSESGGGGEIYIILLIMGNRTVRTLQLPLKSFPDSSISSLIPAGWCEERASRHQKLAPTFPWIDNCLMETKRDFLKMEASL